MIFSIVTAFRAKSCALFAKSRIYWLGLLVAVAAGLCHGGGATPLSAQFTETLWSEPGLLSDPSVDAWAPTLAADRAGNVHVVWSQTMTSDPPPGEGDTLYYARWDRTDWSIPVDILVSPEGAAQWPDLAVTSDGILHLVWGTGGQDSRLLYSWAPACCADSPTSWSTPVQLYTPILATSSIVADEMGRLHVAFSSSETGSIMYLYSTDGGTTWSRPVNMVGEMRPGEFPVWPRLAVDGRERVHLVWSVLPWPGKAVLYARSDDGGMTWNPPQIIDHVDWGGYASDAYGPIYIDVEAVGEDEVHLIWDGAPTVERNHLWSVDGGQSWAGPDLLFPEVTAVGRSGWNDMAVDSDGTLHAISIPGLHATWLGSRWSASHRFVQVGGELFRAVITQGNTLHVVWSRKVEQPFTTRYARGQIAVPELVPQELPEPTLEQTMTPVTTETKDSVTTPVVMATLQYPKQSAPVQTASLTGLLFPVLWGVLPVLVFVGLAMIVAFKRGR